MTHAERYRAMRALGVDLGAPRWPVTTNAHGPPDEESLAGQYGETDLIARAALWLWSSDHQLGGYDAYRGHAYHVMSPERAPDPDSDDELMRVCHSRVTLGSGDSPAETIDDTLRRLVAKRGGA